MCSKVTYHVSMHFRSIAQELYDEESLVLHNVDPSIFENHDVIDMGLKIEKLIPTANKSLEGFIMICYINAIVSLTISSFNLVSSISLNDVHTDQNRPVLCGIFIFASAMYLTRLYILTKAGQTLGNRIKHSRMVLEDNIISQVTSPTLKKNGCNNLFLLRKRLEVYQFLYPIAPYGVFPLGYRTLFATLATMLSYIVVLIKLRGMETLTAVSALNGRNETLSA